jgi:cell division protein FtsQ
MAKKKTDENLSPRQRQSQKIMRDKESHLRRQQLFFRVKIILVVVMVVGGAGFSFWAWKNNAVSRSTNMVVDKMFGVTADAGFKVENLYLEGRSRTPMEEIDKALNIDKNDPILRLSLDEMRVRLEHIASIKHAAIERVLPSTLHVRIVEREPVAMWQNAGKIALVDDNGVVMNGLDIAPYKNLPLIVGEGAPKHVMELIALLIDQPDLAKRFNAGVWVGDRRWNIKLKASQNAPDGTPDIEIRLPEKHSFAAWKKLAELQKKQQVLDRDVKVIDLRIDGRLFIKLPETETEPKTDSVKEPE